MEQRLARIASRHRAADVRRYVESPAHAIRYVRQQERDNGQRFAAGDLSFR